jgi:Fe2+ or Zn2+ uptake regulation protein
VDPTGTAFAELIARNSSHTDHRLAVLAILNAPEPGCIENLIDRRVHKYGNPRQETVYRQLMLAQGSRYVPEGVDHVFNF